MRNYRYPNAIPPIGEPLVDSAGLPTNEFRRFLESIVIQTGGQGGDEIYDLIEGQVNIVSGDKSYGERK